MALHIPAGGRLLFAGGDRSVELLTVFPADVIDGTVVPVLIASPDGHLATSGIPGERTVASGNGKVIIIPDQDSDIPMEGTAGLPTADGLIYASADLDAERGLLTVHLPDPPRAWQRRGSPRLPVGLPLRGTALPMNLPAGTLRAAAQIRFHGVTIDLAPGGVSALLVVESPGLRLPQDVTDVFIEIAPDGPRAIVASLNVIDLRSDVLRAEFAFLPLLDWLHLSAQAEVEAKKKRRRAR
jgi:hypothetical protein